MRHRTIVVRIVYECCGIADLRQREQDKSMG